MSNPKGNEPTLVKFVSKWNSGATKTIRVPVAIAEQVLEYARELDKLQLKVDSNFAEDKNVIAAVVDQLVTSLKSQVASKELEVEQLEKKIAEIKAITKNNPNHHVRQTRSPFGGGGGNGAERPN